MRYHLDFTDKAKEDIEIHKKSVNKPVLKKLLVLLDELTDHPFSGTGKPEALKYALKGCWSRRINREHRLIYEVSDTVVFVLSAYGHYE